MMILLRNIAVSLAILCAFGCSSNKSQVMTLCDPDGCRQSDRAVDQADNSHAQISRKFVVPSYQGEPLAELDQRAEQNDSTALFLLGLISEKGLAGQRVDVGRAFALYRRSADAGSFDGAFKCGSMLIEGRGTARDIPTGLSMIRNAAINDHPLANWYLGILFEKGGYVEQSSTEAFRFFSRAADMDVVDAFNNLGIMYITGRGTTADSYKGKVYLEKAAERDVTSAQKALGMAYARGLSGIPYDLSQAQRWLSIVAAKGDNEAARELKSIENAIVDEIQYRRDLQMRRVEAQAAYANMMTSWMITSWYPRYYRYYE